MAGMIKAVIWDMGGVILRTEDETSRKELAEKYGMSLNELYSMVFNSETASLATLGKISEEQHWLAIGQQLNLSADELHSFQSDFWAGDVIDRELISFIDSLKEKYKTGLLSNAWSGARGVKKLQRYLDVFQYSVFSCELGLAKPDPQIYLKMLDLMEVEPEEAVFVDDLQVNIDAANQLGIHGIRFSGMEQAKSDVLALLGR